MSVILRNEESPRIGRAGAGCGGMDRGRAEILVFEGDGRRYGLPAAEVRELARAVTIVPLPRPRALVEGVIDVRGEAVPVLDLRARLGLPAKGVEPSDHLVIARAS